MLGNKKKSLESILSVFSKVSNDLNDFISKSDIEKENLKNKKSEIESKILKVEDETTKAINVSNKIKDLIS